MRIVAACVFLQHGTAKLFGIPAPVIPGGGTVELTSQLGLAAILETIGGMLLLIGFFSRITAFVLSGETAFAYFIAHAPQGFWPVRNQGAEAVLFSFLWLYVSAAGPGPWSIDAIVRRVPSKHVAVERPGHWRVAS
jgi:putative oxidoreductase